MFIGLSSFEYSAPEKRAMCRAITLHSEPPGKLREKVCLPNADTLHCSHTKHIEAEVYP